MKHGPHARRSSGSLALLLAAASLVLASALAGCASRPVVRTHVDPALRMADYRSFGFVAEPGTNRAGYSTFITSYFKEAVRREMEGRGFVFAEAEPDLLVNFNANAREVTEVRSTPGFGPPFGYGYYGYRSGLYLWGPWYGPDIDTVRYRIGTANIDVVDARRKQVIWEGIIEGRLTDAAMRDPQQAISDAVHQMFERFPARAGGG